MLVPKSGDSQIKTFFSACSGRAHDGRVPEVLYFVVIRGPNKALPALTFIFLCNTKWAMGTALQVLQKVLAERKVLKRLGGMWMFRQIRLPECLLCIRIVWISCYRIIFRVDCWCLNSWHESGQFSVPVTSETVVIERIRSEEELWKGKGHLFPVNPFLCA